MKYQLGTDAYTTNYTDLWGYGHSNGTGQVGENIYTVNEVNSLFTANYDWKITPEFDMNILVGNEFVNKTTKHSYTYGSNFNFRTGTIWEMLLHTAHYPNTSKNVR